MINNELVQQVKDGTHCIDFDIRLNSRAILNKVLKECFPTDKMLCSGMDRYYYSYKNFPTNWIGSDYCPTGLTPIPLDLFFVVEEEKFGGKSKPKMEDYERGGIGADGVEIDYIDDSYYEDLKEWEKRNKQSSPPPTAEGEKDIINEIESIKTLSSQVATGMPPTNSLKDCPFHYCDQNPKCTTHCHYSEGGFQLGEIVYHNDVYDGKEPFKIVGIRATELELEGDWSGGTHAVCQKGWMPILGITRIKSIDYGK